MVIQILEDEQGYTVHCVFDVVLIMYKTQGYTDILCNVHIHDVAYSVSYIRSTVKAEVSKDIFCQSMGGDFCVILDMNHSTLSEMEIKV